MHRSSRPVKADAGLTRKLVEAAAAMEAKLAQLKIFMLQERAKREAMAAAGISGSIWSNGSAGVLRKDTPGATTSQQPSVSSAQAHKLSNVASSSKSRMKPAGQRLSSAGAVTAALQTEAAPSALAASSPSAKKPTAGAAYSSPTACSRNSSRTEWSGSCKPDMVICSKHSASGGMGCGEAAAGSLLDGVHEEAANRSSFQEAVKEWRAAGATSSNASNCSRNSSLGWVGTSGPGAAGSLLRGTYDEVANRDRCQQQALNEWRAAASSTNTGIRTEASQMQAAALGHGTQGKQVDRLRDTAAIICQTESQDTAALAGSLSRGAGIASGCSGSYLVRMLASSRSASINQGAGFAVSSTSRNGSRPSSSPQDQLLERQLVLNQRQESSTRELSTCTAMHKGTAEGGSSSSSERDVVEAAGQEEQHSEDEHSDSDSQQPAGGFHFDDWMSILQETEQAAANLASAPSFQANGAGACAARAVAAAEPAAVVQERQYQQQLQQVLAKLEQLEHAQPHAATLPVLHSPATVYMGGMSTGVLTCRLPDAVEPPHAGL